MEDVQDIVKKIQKYATDVDACDASIAALEEHFKLTKIDPVQMEIANLTDDEKHHIYEDNKRCKNLEDANNMIEELLRENLRLKSIINNLKYISTNHFTKVVDAIVETRRKNADNNRKNITKVFDVLNKIMSQTESEVIH